VDGALRDRPVRRQRVIAYDWVDLLPATTFELDGWPYCGPTEFHYHHHVIFNGGNYNAILLAFSCSCLQAICKMSAHPDFMIIGAPKCGTTSLASWLGAHTGIFMASPKEPAHFSKDIKTVGAIRDPHAYDALFRNAGSAQSSGEASTTYLRSRVAVPAVLARRPETKLIVCLRNPVEMMPSVHGQLLRGGRENLTDPAQAWAAQDARRQGRDLPPFCPEPADLDYATACALGSQVGRLLDVASRDQIHFIFNEDMHANPGAVYRSVLAFLSIADDGRTDFTSLNQRSASRSFTMNRAVARASALRRRFWRGGSSLGLGKLIARLNTSPAVSTAAIDPGLRAQLTAHFANDINTLAVLAGRDLSEWLS
jgi:hypothetical protein